VPVRLVPAGFGKTVAANPENLYTAVYGKGIFLKVFSVSGQKD
jgi:hypothetical protein